MGDEQELSTGPLEGIRVLDLSTSRAELAGRVLADLGADVLKVEPPGGADSRRRGPYESGFEGDPAHSLYWAAVALGKRSVTLDLATDDGRRRVRELARDADILVESFDPGYMASIGLDYLFLSKESPGLIYVSVTPYGQDGPRAHWAATESTTEAAGGLTGLQGDPDRPPLPVGYPQAAFHAGVQAAADAIIALNERQRSGLGQHLDVSMQAAVVWTLMNATGYPPNTGADVPGRCEDRQAPGVEIAPGVRFPPIWECKDGYVQASFTVGSLGGRTLVNLIRLIEAEGELSPELATTGWTAWTETAAPGAVPAEILLVARDEIERYLRRRTQEELMERAVDHALLVAPIRSIAGLLAEPQLKSRDYWENVGGHLHPGKAVKLSRTPMALRAPAPATPGPSDATWLSPAGPRPDPGKRRPGGRVFDGLKVADFAWVGVGPLISKALADHGATVVHVESHVRPDVLRLGQPATNNEPGIDRSQFFANFNSSKLGVGLDLSLPEGRAVARKLIDWADVVVESFSPGVIEAFGFGYAELSRERPDLVMVSTCLCGQTGPYAKYRGFGTQGSALAGIHGITGWPDRPPAGTWGAYTDFIAPRYGVAALAAALYDRDRTGLGQHIDLGQVEAAIHFIEPLVLDYTVNGRMAAPAGHSSWTAAPHGVFPAAGRERFVAIAVETDEQWRALAALSGLADEPGFATHQERRDRAHELNERIAKWTAGRDPWALVSQLQWRGVPASVVQWPSDLYNDPQLEHRGFFVTCHHTVMGTKPYDGPVTLFSATPPRLLAAPCLGEHSEYVLREILEMDGDSVAELAAAGVLG